MPLTRGIIGALGTLLFVVPAACFIDYSMPRRWRPVASVLFVGCGVVLFVVYVVLAQAVTGER